MAGPICPSPATLPHPPSPLMKVHVSYFLSSVTVPHFLLYFGNYVSLLSCVCHCLSSPATLLFPLPWLLCVSFARLPLWCVFLHLSGFILLGYLITGLHFHLTKVCFLLHLHVSMWVLNLKKCAASPTSFSSSFLVAMVIAHSTAICLWQQEITCIKSHF